MNKDKGIKQTGFFPLPCIENESYLWYAILGVPLAQTNSHK